MKTIQNPVCYGLFVLGLIALTLLWLELPSQRCEQDPIFYLKGSGADCMIAYSPQDDLDTKP